MKDSIGWPSDNLKHLKTLLSSNKMYHVSRNPWSEAAIGFVLLLLR